MLTFPIRTSLPKPNAPQATGLPATLRTLAHSMVLVGCSWAISLAHAQSTDTQAPAVPQADAAGQYTSAEALNNSQDLALRQRLFTLREKLLPLPSAICEQQDFYQAFALQEKTQGQIEIGQVSRILEQRALRDGLAPNAGFAPGQTIKNINGVVPQDALQAYAVMGKLRNTTGWFGRKTSLEFELINPDGSSQKRTLPSMDACSIPFDALNQAGAARLNIEARDAKTYHQGQAAWLNSLGDEELLWLMSGAIAEQEALASANTRAQVGNIGGQLLGAILTVATGGIVPPQLGGLAGAAVGVKSVSFDHIVFAAGLMLRLGYTPEQVEKMIAELPQNPAWRTHAMGHLGFVYSPTTPSVFAKAMQEYRAMLKNGQEMIPIRSKINTDESKPKSNSSSESNS